MVRRMLEGMMGLSKQVGVGCWWVVMMGAESSQSRGEQQGSCGVHRFCLQQRLGLRFCWLGTGKLRVVLRLR